MKYCVVASCLILGLAACQDSGPQVYEIEGTYDGTCYIHFWSWNPNVMESHDTLHDLSLTIRYVESEGIQGDTRYLYSVDYKNSNSQFYVLDSGFAGDTLIMYYPDGTRTRYIRTSAEIHSGNVEAIGNGDFRSTDCVYVKR